MAGGRSRGSGRRGKGGGKGQNTDRKEKYRTKLPAHGALYFEIPKQAIPPSHCEYCKPGDAKREADDDAFDENGYPIVRKRPKVSMLGGDGHYQSISAQTIAQTASASASTSQPFRFLDLPPELRNRIYELVFTREKQPVCIPDDLLRPSDDLPDPGKVLRKCYEDVICLPCQLLDKLGIASCGLTRVSQQLYEETAMIPYAVNTFSVHNLFYLQTLLQLVGDKGRQHIRSLRFKWKLPEEEANAHGMYTNVLGTYMLLRGCKKLSGLEVDVDVLNLLKWRGNGNPRSEWLQHLGETLYIEQIYEIRGLRQAKIGWAETEGLTGMADWARSLIGHWRLPQGIDESKAEAVEVPIQSQDDSDNKRWVEWRA